ncbi:MAG: CopG family transcriptional regulator [Cyanobacteria bacterium J06634_5]
MKKQTIKVSDADERFDCGEDLSEFIDYSKVRHPGRVSSKVSLDFPTWMVDALDREAQKLGVTRQSIITAWLAERLEQV